MTMAASDAVILGSSETALGALRLLGREGVNCAVCDFDSGGPAFKSRYCAARIDIRTNASDTEIVTKLCSRFARAPQKPVLIPTSDHLVRLVSACRDQLSRVFRFIVAEATVIADLLDKERFAARATERGWPVPRAISVRAPEDFDQAAKTLGFPLILKPTKPYEATSHRLPKALVVFEQSQLDRAKAGWQPDQVGAILAQQFIRGDESSYLSVAACLREGGEVVATFVSRKRRQSSRGAGIGTYVESWVDSHAEDLALRVLRDLGYVGVAEVELKRDASDGALRVIEINPRLWSQVSLAAACGINFPKAAWMMAAGLRVAHQSQDARAVCWQDFWDDFYSTFRSRGYRAVGDVSVWTWLHETLQVGARPHFCWRDPYPAIYRSQTYLLKALQARVCRLRRARTTADAAPIANSPDRVHAIS